MMTINDKIAVVETEYPFGESVLLEVRGGRTVEGRVVGVFEGNDDSVAIGVITINSLEFIDYDDITYTYLNIGTVL